MYNNGGDVGSMENAHFQEKNTELAQYIDELANVQEKITEQIRNTTDITEKQRLANNLELIEDTRSNLTNALSSINSYYTQNLVSASDTLQQQTDAVAIIDKEMSRAKKRLAYINEQKEDKLRVVEINQYYSASYAEWTKLLKYVIYLVIAIMVLIIIRRNFPFVPQIIYSLLMISIVGYGLYCIITTIVSIGSRDKMVYDEYNWYFTAPLIDLDKGTGENSFKLPTVTCIGETCCEAGTIWNDSTKRCDPQVSTTTSRCSPSLIDI